MRYRWLAKSCMPTISECMQRNVLLLLLRFMPCDSNSSILVDSSIFIVLEEPSVYSANGVPRPCFCRGRKDHRSSTIQTLLRTSRFL